MLKFFIVVAQPVQGASNNGGALEQSPDMMTGVICRAPARFTCRHCGAGAVVRLSLKPIVSYR